VSARINNQAMVSMQYASRGAAYFAVLPERGMLIGSALAHLSPSEVRPA